MHKIAYLCSYLLEMVKGFSSLLLLFNFDICVKSYGPSKFLKHRRLCVTLVKSEMYLEIHMYLVIHLEGLGICWTPYGKFTNSGNGEPLFTSASNGEKNSPLPAVVKKLVTTAGSGEFP